MKIAISADDTNLDAQISHRFGISPYFIITELETGEIEVVKNLGSSGKRGANWFWRRVVETWRKPLCGDCTNYHMGYRGSRPAAG